MLVKTLIDNASKIVGTRYKLAKIMGVSPSQVYDWQEERKRCSPADRARLAAFGGSDAVRELVDATIADYAGTIRGDQLAVALQR